MQTMDNQQRSIEEKLSWLGGIIDGEGCITATAGHTKTGHGHFYKHRRYIPLVNIVNTDLEIINEIKTVLEEANIPYWVNTKGRTLASNPTWKPKWEFMITGMKRCARALDVLIPYLRSSKRFKAQLLKQWIDYRMTQEQKKEYTEVDYSLLSQIRTSMPLRDYTPSPIPQVGEDIVQHSVKTA